jgi:hypothetical protein
MSECDWHDNVTQSSEPGKDASLLGPKGEAEGFDLFSGDIILRNPR